MKTIASILILLFVATQGQAQTEYQKKTEKDGMIVTYNWRPSVKKEPDSQLELDIAVENTNAYAADVSFVVAFYQAGELIEDSGVLKLCIKPGQTLKGKKYGLSLISESITNEQIKNDEGFDWELDEFKVKETNGCN